MEKAGTGAGALLYTGRHFRPYFWPFTVVFITGSHWAAGLAFLESAASVMVAVG
jgi:hypothetical protein